MKRRPAKNTKVQFRLPDLEAQALREIVSSDFDSISDAVTWALETQFHLRERARAIKSDQAAANSYKLVARDVGEGAYLEIQPPDNRPPRM